MKKKKLLVIAIILLSIVTVIAVRFDRRNQLLEESYEVQILENLFKPLDLAYLHLAFSPNNLPKYEITATRTDLIKLYNTLPKTKDENEINQKRIVEDRKYIPVKIKIDGTEYVARMSVRGHNYRNYLGDKKSLRIRLRSNQGAPINAINFIVPEERSFIDDQTNYLFSQKLGLFSLKPGFAWVSLNGSSLGVFQTLEDQEDKSLLENHGLSPEDIFYGPEYKQQVISGGPWPSLLESIEYWKLNNQGNGNPSPFSPLERLIEINKLNGAEFYTKIQEVLDIDQYLKFAAANYVMGDPHQDNVHNMSLLFRKEKGLIWFVPNNNSVAPVKNLQGYHFNDFTEKMLKNPEFYWKRNKILWELTNDSNFQNQLTTTINDIYDLLKAPIYQDTLKPFRFIAFKTDINKSRKILNDNFQIIRSYFEKYTINTSASYLPEQNLITLIAETNTFFQPAIRSIKLLQNMPGSGSVTAYFDTDGNGTLGSGDTFAAQADASGQKELDLKVDKPIEAAEFMSSPIDEITPTAKSQILITGISGKISKMNIEVDFYNTLTGETIHKATASVF